MTECAVRDRAPRR